MPLIFFLILGLAVASVKANETTTNVNVSSIEDQMLTVNDSTTKALVPTSIPVDTPNVTSIITPNITSIITPNITSIITPNITSIITPNITSIITPNITSISTTTTSMNISDPSSTTTPTTTKRTGDKRSTADKVSKAVTSTKSSTKPGPDKVTPNSGSTANDNTGIIVLVLIILAAVLFAVACYFTRKRGRRYSVDFTSRPDDANIPLSVMEPELPVDTVPQNGLQTFESPETTAKEPQEPEEKPEAQEQQKAEPDKSVNDPTAESAAPAPAPDSSEDKPKADVVEQSPPAPVEPSVEEKTDDKGVVSNKTSVELLKEANENNSNNTDFGQKRDVKSMNVFWEVPPDCPV